MDEHQLVPRLTRGCRQELRYKWAGAPTTRPNREWDWAYGTRVSHMPKRAVVHPTWTDQEIHIREGYNSGVTELLDTVYGFWSLP
jgi:hypothetical protein